MMAMRKTMDERARKKALDAIFNRFDFNQNGEVFCEKLSYNVKHVISGKIFIKDFFDELEMQEIEVNQEEIEKITKFSDTEGQVKLFKEKSEKKRSLSPIFKYCLQQSM